MFVCLIVFHKRQNSLTESDQILCETSHDPRKGLWMLKITKCVSKSLWFWENFEIARKIIIKFASFFRYLLA